MLRTRIREALADAANTEDESSIATLRLISAALKDRDIAARGRGNLDGVSDEEILEMLRAMIDQRRESVATYEQGGRIELAEREAEEIAVIERFLPQQLSDAEIEAEVDGAIAATGARTLKDVGRIMGILKERHPGAMDAAKASALVKARLAG